MYPQTVRNEIFMRCIFRTLHRLKEKLCRGKKKNTNKGNSCKINLEQVRNQIQNIYIQQQRKEVERVMQWYIHFQPQREGNFSLKVYPSDIYIYTYIQVGEGGSKLACSEPMKFLRVSESSVMRKLAITR